MEKQEEKKDIVFQYQKIGIEGADKNTTLSANDTVRQSTDEVSVNKTCKFQMSKDVYDKLKKIFEERIKSNIERRDEDIEADIQLRKTKLENSLKDAKKNITEKSNDIKNELDNKMKLIDDNNIKTYVNEFGEKKTENLEKTINDISQSLSDTGLKIKELRSNFNDINAQIREIKSEAARIRSRGYIENIDVQSEGIRGTLIEDGGWFSSGKKYENAQIISVDARRKRYLVRYSGNKSYISKLCVVDQQ